MNKNMFLLTMLSLAFGVFAETQGSSTVNGERSQKRAQKPMQRILSEPQEAKPVSGSTDSSWKMTQQKKDSTEKQDKKTGELHNKTAPHSDKKQLNH